MWMVVLGTAAWIIGLIFARIFYGAVKDHDPLSKHFPGFFDLCKCRLFFDEIYRFYVDKIQDPFARFFRGLGIAIYHGVDGQRFCRDSRPLFYARQSLLCRKNSCLCPLVYSGNDWFSSLFSRSA